MFVTRLWPWIFAGLCLGGIAHILSILLLPALSRQDATSRLSVLGPVNGMKTLPGSGPSGGPVPFSDPNVATAICPFDLMSAPLRIRVASGQEFLTVAFLQPGGSIFYSLSDRANASGALDVRLATGEQLLAIEAGDPDDQPVAELRVKSPSATGVALVRAVAPAIAMLPLAEQRVSRASCAPEPISR